MTPFIQIITMDKLRNTKIMGALGIDTIENIKKPSMKLLLNRNTGVKIG